MYFFKKFSISIHIFLFTYENSLIQNTISLKCVKQLGVTIGTGLQARAQRKPSVRTPVSSLATDSWVRGNKTLIGLMGQTGDQEHWGKGRREMTEWFVEELRG